MSETGGRLNQLIEHVNRLATYKALRKAGKESHQAKWLTDQIHYNYGRLKGGASASSFETNLCVLAIVRSLRPRSRISR